MRDTGVGIPAEALPRIFEMFTQADQSLNGSGGGLGIGLALVKRLVEMHGGVITAHSDGSGQGSEFIVRLPVVQSPRVEHQASLKAEQTAQRFPLRILVVDDNWDSAGSLAELLKMEGNDTRTAHDGLEAVTRAEEFRPDVVLLDIGLPRMNGYEAAWRIRQASWGKKMLLIATTGWSQETDKRRAKQAGFDRHLVKPIDTAFLTQLLASVAMHNDRETA